VKKAKEIGIGGKIDATAGAAIDHRYAGPVRLQGEITAIREGDIDAKTEVVVKCGNISVIVTERRKGYHKEKDFTGLGLNPRETDILVVKIGYLEPELYAMRGDWVMHRHREGRSGFVPFTLQTIAATHFSARLYDG